MGLDISAYEKLVFLTDGSGFDEEGEVDYDNDFMLLYLNPDFPEQASDLPKDLPCKSVGGALSFRAGSYGGYNAWRSQLAEFAGYPLGPDSSSTGRPMIPSFAAGAWSAPAGPFWELIKFSDCEGTIGPAICKKLATDFAIYQEVIDDNADDYFKELYAQWRSAFELASKEGAVSFH